MSLQYFLSVDSLITAIVAFVFGLIVISKNWRNKINQTGFLLTVATAFWSFFYWLWLSVYDDKEAAIFWLRMLSIGSTFIPVFYFHWIISLLGIEKNIKNKIILFFSYLFALVCLIFSFSPLFIKDVRPIVNFSFWPEAGSLYTVYLFLIYFGLVIYSIFLLLNHYKNSFGLMREQIKYVLLGSILGFGGGVTNFFLWYDIKILPLGNVLVILYPILFSYSIIRHRLMDIKLVMRRYSVYLVSLSFILILATAVKYFVEIYYPDYSNWLDLFILLISISIYPSIRNYFYRLANKYFFSSLYDSGEVIASLSDKLRSTLEAEKIYEYVFNTLAGTFHIKAFGIMILDEKNNFYVIRYNQGFKVGAQNYFPGDESLHKMFVEQNKIIVTEEVRRLNLFEKNQTIDLLLKLKVEILAPLNVKDKTIGLIALGAKESGDMYNEEDLQVLEVVGAQAAIALENALLYKETKNFSIKMEKEVEKATRDLRKANIQLKKLDAAKSEFISIASHQLRTPLTVIKGYISMMLEGNFGVLTKPETESLEKVFLSNERLIQLVENLLNISRIESGRLQFDYKQVDLNKMAESVIEELSGNAKKKNLILQFKPPAKPVAELKLDEEKIRQVMMNLIDNGIKYTKQGSVTVKLEQTDKKVQFSVADSGMGIRPEDMANLFKKFSRGTGTSLIHTEGTGLGLYVARMMIEAHHGKIWAESDGEGKGSKFCFELPVK